jgi:hypothetical protein
VGWPLKRMLLVMLAGTIPFLSFWAERRVTHSWVADKPDKAASDHALKA